MLTHQLLFYPIDWHPWTPRLWTKGLQFTSPCRKSSLLATVMSRLVSSLRVKSHIHWAPYPCSCLWWISAYPLGPIQIFLTVVDFYISTGPHTNVSVYGNFCIFTGPPYKCFSLWWISTYPLGPILMFLSMVDFHITTGPHTNVSVNGRFLHISWAPYICFSLW